MPTSKSSLDKRDVYYRKGKSDGAYCKRSGVACALAVPCHRLLGATRVSRNRADDHRISRSLGL